MDETLGFQEYGEVGVDDWLDEAACSVSGLHAVGIRVGFKNFNVNGNEKVRIERMIFHFTGICFHY